MKSSELPIKILEADSFFLMENSTAWLVMRFHLQALDYESKRDYEFRVEVKNSYLDERFVNGLQFKDYTTVKVTVEDVDEPPVFTRNPYIIEVHEDTASGSFVGVVSARDPDADNKPVKYATGFREQRWGLALCPTVRENSFPLAFSDKFPSFGIRYSQFCKLAKQSMAC